MADWVACPHCGERIKRDAAACRHCGSDDRTGWSEDTYLDGVDLPEAGEYSAGLEEEGFAKPANPPGRAILAGVSAVLILLFAFWLFGGMFR